MITTQIVQVVDNEEPDAIIIEGAAMQGKGRVLDLAELGGNVKQALYYHVTPRGSKPALLVCAPSSLKAFAGHGKADKAMMKGFAAEYGQIIENDNICDAFLLTLAGLCYFNYEFSSYTWSNRQRKLADNIDLLKGIERVRVRNQ